MPKGMYNSYTDNPQGIESVPRDILEIELIQFDAFRPAFITKTAGTQSFMIHRTGQHTVVSLIYTNIKEFATGDRDGYVVFSLIIPKNYSFENSPRGVLSELASFYKSRAEKSAQNNFSKDEINSFLQRISIKTTSTSPTRGSYSYNYKSASELDNILKCDIPYLNFNELILVDEKIDFASLGLERKVRAELGIQEYAIRSINFAQLQSEHALAEQKKLDALNASKGILSLIQRNEIDKALKEYDGYRNKDLLSNEVKRSVAKIKDERNAALQKSKIKEKDLELKSSIIIAIENNDLKLANSYFKKLNDRNILEDKYRLSISGYLEDMRRNEALEREAHSRRKRKLFVLVSLLTVFLVASITLLYIFVFSAENDENKSSVARQTIEPDSKVKNDETINNAMTKSDSLRKGLEVFTGSIPENEKLDSTMVRYKENRWEYLDQGSNNWKTVNAEVSLKTLEQLFPGVIERTIDSQVPQKDPETEEPQPQHEPKPPANLPEKDPCDGYKECKNLQNDLINNSALQEGKKNSYMAKFKTLKNANCPKVNEASFKLNHNKVLKKYNKLDTGQ
ncbi:MAG: hypothetical protein DCO96_03755 [Fluviicola sp. XM-24bin1]|nr:MAG: hypothetical protein DCO96_03755 [Fluviicola sp. XM-24bin1]